MGPNLGNYERDSVLELRGGMQNTIILEMFEFKLKFELFSNFKLSEHLIESAYKITPVS